MINKTEIKKVSFNGSKYVINIQLYVPKINIRNILNYRIFEIKKYNNETIRDPNIVNSNYIFFISKNNIEKFININFEFDKESFEEISEFIFDFCDENISWLNMKIFYKNKYFNNKQYIKRFNKNILSEDLLSYLKSDDFLKIVES